MQFCIGVLLLMLLSVQGSANSQHSVYRIPVKKHAVENRLSPQDSMNVLASKYGATPSASGRVIITDCRPKNFSSRQQRIILLDFSCKHAVLRHHLSRLAASEF